MKKGLLSLALLLGASALMQAKGKEDPVLMTVGGKPVTLSEFEYLYHKNNAQQSTPQAIEEYLKLFIPYRQKVAAAEELGLDRTETFRNEFDTYRRDLSAPYLVDQAVEDSILAAQYDRMKEEVDVSHIMLFFQSPDMTMERKRELMDSLHTCLDRGENFDSLAVRYSADRQSATRGGRMGYILANRYPAAFEEAAYTVPVGEYSDVIASPVGFHIVKVNARRPARGQVLAEHILRLTRGKTPQEVEAQKAYIDSLYTMVSNGASFEAVAAENSEDPGSAAQGGKLPWFGVGQMVPEFEDMAFSLKDGEISKPFATAYGYHIIKRLESKGIDSFENVKANIKNAISRDERGQLPAKRRLQQLRKQYGAKADAKALAKLKQQILANGGVDSAMMVSMVNSDVTVARIGKEKLPLSEVMSEELTNGFAGTPELQAAQLEQAVERHLDAVTIETKRDALMAEEPDYRNLVNEYRDGILLYEIANRNVWDRASKDHEGLEAFFKANAGKYRWEQPKFKSYVFFASSDSLLDKAVEYADSLSTDDPTAFTQDMRKRFGRDIKIERVIAAKGENAITDYLGFGAEKPAADGKSKWTSYRAYKGRVLEQPEEAADVRGAAVTDYQAKLEADWLKELHKRYKVKVNKKVFKKLKSEQK